MWTRTLRLVILASLCAASVAAAQMSSRPNPPTDPITPVNPDPIADLQFVPVWHPSPIVPDPDAHVPPLDTIPPMPMPEGSQNADPAVRPQAVMVYDALTGESREIPIADPDDLPEAMRSTPEFRGVGLLAAGNEYARGLGTMVAATNAELQAFPANPNCKLAMRFVKNGTDYWFSCSGTLTDAGVVLTAGHCVYTHSFTTGNPPVTIAINDWATEIYVYPGWDGAAQAPPANTVSQYWGYARGTQFLSNTAYINNQDFNADLGAIRLQRTVTRNVGMLTGWYGYGFTACDSSQTHYNWSYPAETCNAPLNTLHTGRQMYFWSGTIDGCPNILRGNKYLINTTPGCLTSVWGGMSGSSLYRFVNNSRTALAVCSTSDRSSYAYYCALTDWFFAQLNDWRTGTRTSTFDVEALRYRLTSNVNVQAGTQTPTATVTISNATDNDPPARTFTLRVYLSPDNTIDASDTLLQTFNYSNIDFAPMQNKTFNIPALTIPVNTPANNYWIGCVLDAASDTNPNNNNTKQWDAAQITITPCARAAQVNNVNAIGRCNGIDISWDFVPGATSYNIYRNTANNSGASTLITSTTATQYTDTGVVAGPTFYYWIQAVNACGPGFLSNPGSAQRQGALQPPTNVSATDGQGCNSIRVTWNASAYAYRYDIYRATTNNFATSQFRATVFGTSYEETGIPANTTYWYWVIAGSQCASASGAPDSGRAGGALSFYLQPQTHSVFENANTTFSAAALGAVTYRWYHGVTALTDSAHYSGTDTTTLTIYGCTNADAGLYRLFATSPCGNVFSANSTLTVEPPPACAADFNGDGGIDGSDLQAFFAAWENQSDPRADVNQDGGIDGADVDAFYVIWENQIC
ncbi:MAG: hypothetical protein JSR77_14420 [Planctomycetes bacterium]|nr:hypothetical protein [Planctomycetota bacterium]